MESEYSSVALGEVASVRSGFAFSSADWSDLGVPVVKIGNVRDGRLAMDACSFVSPVVAASAAEFDLAAGDILIAMTGYIGDVALVRSSDLPAVLNQRVGRFSIRDSQRLDSRFLFYLLRDPTIRAEIEGLGYGSAQPNVSPSLIHRVRVPLPPLAKQRRIVRILSALDDKIEVNRRINQTLEAIVRALFKSWFVDFDPVHIKADRRSPDLPPQLADLFPDSFVDSRIGEIPAGWVVGSLGDLARRIVDRVEDIRGWRGEPLIDLRRMPQRSIALTDWGLGGELTTSVTRFHVRDTLFGAIRPYFHKVGIAPIDGVTNISVFVLRAKHAADWPIVALLCSMDATVDYATRVAQGTKMPVVGWTDFGTYPIPLPPANTRAAFSRAAAPLMDRMVRNIHEARALSAARDTLLPKLLTGRLRVDDVEQFDEVDA